MHLLIAHGKYINMINVQIVYALPGQATIIDCEVDDPCEVLNVITKSNILSLCKLNLSDHSIGIYGKLCQLTDFVKDGDRIEIYRSLINDPKEIRRKRAALRK